MPVRLPEPDRRILTPAPVRTVICQLRFDSDPGVSDRALGREWATRLQSEYPRFDQLQSETVSIQGGADQPLPTMQRERESGWQFSSESGDWSITLLPGSLALETKAYSDWDDFLSRFSTVLDVLANTVEPAVEGRVGLRYINELGRVDQLEGQVKPPTAGLVSDPVLRTGVVKLEQAVQLTLEGGVGAIVRFSLPAASENATLDIDAYRASGRPFDPQATKETLAALNTSALALFQACIREEQLASLRAKQ